MAAFNFPDPPIEHGTLITNPSTGIKYQYEVKNDRWVAVKTDLVNDVVFDMDGALTALAQAQQDIIELKSKVSSLELTSFLILE